jgi:copper chaperone NosL
MKKRVSKWMVIATLLPLILFVSPMWRITLEAPQYPKGISMYIWVNKLTGESPSTIQNINILNHYVGMQYIDEEMFPELTYFPYVIIGMVLFGLVAVFSKNRKIYLTWSIVFVIISLLGIYDFYLWLYDYGHNLSDTAPIKVPGQAYQPPLIGSKMLLNFNAISWPHWGGIAMGFGILFGFIAYFYDKKK